MFKNKFKKSISIILTLTLTSALIICNTADLVPVAGIEKKRGIFGDLNGDGVVDNKDYIKLYQRVNCIPLGDINKDGKVDQEDVDLLDSYVKGLVTFDDEQKICADMTGDGKVTALDYVKLYRYINGLISSLSEESTELINSDLNGDVEVDKFDVNILNDIINTLNKIKN